MCDQRVDSACKRGMMGMHSEQRSATPAIHFVWNTDWHHDGSRFILRKLCSGDTTMQRGPIHGASTRQ